MEDKEYPWKVLGIVMLGTMMAALDSSIVNVSLPAIMADFGASVDEIEWVITGYMLAFATLMPLTTWFREKVGHKNLYLGSLVVFTLGSVFCGVAWNLPTLVLARVVQALGGGAITPTGMAMISEVFSTSKRTKALGYWGMGVILGPAFGPTLGGWLTKLFGWRSIFLVNLPIGIFGVAVGISLLRKDRPYSEGHRKFDLWGFIFLSVFLISFLLGLSKGEQEGWTSAYILSCFIVSLIGLVGFLLVESIVPHGIMDLKLFKYPVFTACMGVTAIRSVALFGGTFLLPLFLQKLRGFDEVQTGLIMLPGSLVIAMIMPITSKLMDRFGPRALTLVGLLGVADFMFMYRLLDINTSTWDIVFPTLVRGLGIGLLFTPVMATALNHIPKTKVAMASSMLNLGQQIAGSIGIAFLATEFSHRFKFHMANFGSEVDSLSPAFKETFSNLFARAHELGYTRSESAMIAELQIRKSVFSISSAGAFEDAFLLGAIIVLIGIGVAMLLPSESLKGDGHEISPME